MPPMFAHEGQTHLVRWFVDVLAEELMLPVRGGGSVTLRRRCRRRGLEPSSCLWIAHADSLLGKTTLDMHTDPPPDLAIEVDVANRSINRMSIYAALGVPEVWRLSSEG